MAEESDFFLKGLKNQYYLGLYDAVLQTLAKPENCPKPASEQQKIDRFVLLQRCLIAQGLASKTVKDIVSSATLPPDLLAVRGLANFITLSSADEKRRALDDLLSLSGANSASLVNVAICAATALIIAGQHAEAIAVLEQHPRDLECIFLMNHVFLSINRFDRARQLVSSMKLWAEDATLAHLIEAQTNLVAADGVEQKILEAFYIFEELEQGRSPSSLVANGRALARIQLGKFSEARSILTDAHSKFPNDQDILANLIRTLYIFNDKDEVTALERKLAQMNGSHPSVCKLAEKSIDFDNAMQRLG